MLPIGHLKNVINGNWSVPLLYALSPAILFFIFEIARLHNMHLPARQRAGRLLAGALVALLFLFGMLVLSSYLIKSIQMQI